MVTPFNQRVLLVAGITALSLLALNVAAWGSAAYWLAYASTVVSLCCLGYLSIVGDPDESAPASAHASAAEGPTTVDDKKEQ